ncbi:hypothetical protein L211DRAFT_778853 [Terfezia boudieri ATCC MYA-4762]|uniref:CHAT domain-containing protein n=1 Tax=Terfezia boudieri ATCC MYA-4762 TaxID=1051890 RepID=A0A3N4M356_9PEZI|nr:hypothetical protein L211DRAFT_778853 [Terfezia boudieri ATCC MYA-4762]
MQVALKAIPESHPNRATCLNNLGNCLNWRYERAGNLEDLEAAINSTQAAVKAMQDDHPGRAEWLSNLGNHFCSRYERTLNPQDLDLAITSWFSAWSIPTASILTRIEAASIAAETLVLRPSATSQDMSRAFSVLRDATHLLPLATPRSLNREDQQHILGQLTGLASLAAAVSLQAGQSPLEALRLQELCRSVTNSQLLDYRTEISDLKEQYPELAKDYDSLRQELDSPNKVVKDLDNILLQIRQKPGFKYFLRAESEEYFLSAAQEGPIVVLNVTELRSDAILLSKSQMLEWLWKAAVQPVLRELGFYPKVVDPLPRVWWIGIGLMAQAPIHAAAKFTRGIVKVKVTTLQYCLPSYTSTIRALQYSRSRQQYQQKASMLIVTMPTTPGQGSLSATKEANEIKQSLRGFSKLDILQWPTAELVLQALPGYSIAHFACHGISSTNPADSHLLLLKGTGDVDKLRVKDIAALKLPAAAARLAYLSACSTANSPSSKLVDEVTHIVSSFHIAGFINVIGALWPSEDGACFKMAADFYSTLNNTDNVAESYRKGILGLMKQKPSQPMYWAPFIHFGA